MHLEKQIVEERRELRQKIAELLRKEEELWLLQRVLRWHRKCPDPLDVEDKLRHLVGLGADETPTSGVSPYEKQCHKRARKAACLKRPVTTTRQWAPVDA